MPPPGPHRLARSSSGENVELLAAIRRQLPRQLPALDARTLEKLKVFWFGRSQKRVSPCPPAIL